LGKSPKVAAGKVKVGGWLLMGGQLGFPGPGGRCRCGTGVRGLHPAVPVLQGGGGLGAGAVLPSSPCPTACARDKAEEGEKETWKGLTGGVHL
jgi:hypothetical protein